MRILLSDGAGLTARQCATLLSLAGHEVEAVCAESLCLCRFTRHVAAVHRVPPCGIDPFGWLDATLEVAARRGAEVLLPVQEQAAVIALAQDRIRAAGLATAVPAFSVLARVQDKISAFRTLARLGLPQPPAYVADSAGPLTGPFPAFVKTPIGTASAGVFRVSTEAEARALAARCGREGVFASGGLLVQQPATGALVMVQAVFAHGSLTAFHACGQVRQGAGGGSSHKRALRIPEARRAMESLGNGLGWHGALSADMILTPQGPVFIDVNPRLVEPVNAFCSGVDLVGALLSAATGRDVRIARSPRGWDAAATHQLLLAVLAAARDRGRRGVLAELRAAATRRGDYQESIEELTPPRGDPAAVLPVAVAAAATLARPGAWRSFTGGSVAAYALTPSAWRQLMAAASGAAATAADAPERRG
jgi:biotin carboxylase